MAVTDLQVQERYTVLSVYGEVDFTVEREVRNAWMTALAGHPRAMLVDLSAVPLLDGSGVRLLLSGCQRTRNRGVAVAVLLSPESHVRRVLELVGLAPVLPLYLERDAALRSLDCCSQERCAGPESPGDRLAMKSRGVEG